MPVPLIAALIALTLALLASVVIVKVLRPREEARAGIAALPELRWREFLQLLIQALSRQGFERQHDPDAGGDESELKMLRDGERWLVSAKYGASFQLGSQAIREFARMIELHGARGGLLVTPGHFTSDAMPEAAQNHIELHDGRRLWPELAPMLPPEQYARFVAPGRQRIRRMLQLGWLLSALLGVAIWLLWPAQPGGEPASGDTSAATPAPASGAGVATAPAAGTGDAAPSPATQDDQAGEAMTLEQRRLTVADAIRTVPGVERAHWSGESTLTILLSGGDIETRELICPILEHHAELRATRLELKPSPESGRMVFYFQCWMY